MNGEKETGVTIMEMIKKMDAGGIYAQESMPITKQDDVGTMFEKLSLLGRKLLLDDQIRRQFNDFFHFWRTGDFLWLQHTDTVL